MQHKKTKSPKDGATRQAKFKEEQRKLGRRRMEAWVTEEERRVLLETLDKLRRFSS